MPAFFGRLRVFIFSLGALLNAALFLISCTSLYVPVYFPGYEPAQVFNLSSAGIEVSAKPLISRQEYYDMFDDYMPEIGLVAVWVQVQNNSTSNVTLSKDKWVLRTGNRNTKQLNTSSILKRYYHGRGIRMYTVHTYTRTRQQIEQLMVPYGRISNLKTIEGFVIFPIDKSLHQDWNKGAVLMNNSIYLNDQKKIEIRLSLDYANP